MAAPLTRENVRDLEPEEVAKGITEGRYLLVDVREPNEIERRALSRRRRTCRLSEFDPSALPDPQGKQVVFACRSGNRSVTASLVAQDAGLPYDAHLAGGIKAWKAVGLPTETLSGQSHQQSHEPRLRRSSGLGLRGDVAPRARARRHQSRPGLSRRSRARGRAAQGGRGGDRRLEPVSADDGPAGAAPGGRGALPRIGRTSTSIPTARSWSRRARPRRSPARCWR